MTDEPKPGLRFAKTGGDYRFEGVEVARFAKRSGAVRVVIENDDGVLHIFNPTQLTPLPPDEPERPPC